MPRTGKVFEKIEVSPEKGFVIFGNNDEAKEPEAAVAAVALQVGWLAQQTEHRRQAMHSRCPVSGDGPYLCIVHYAYRK